MKYYVMYNGHSWFVKERNFFESQGGLTEPWGKHWTPIEAESIEDARAKAKANQDELIERIKEVSKRNETNRIP